MSTLTLNDLNALAELRGMVLRGDIVTFAVDGDADRLVVGVARSFGDENGNFLGEDDDVRDGFIRISGTFEHFIPVRECLDLFNRGLFVIGDFA